MSEKLFSVVVLNYNYERYLGKAIDSALGQTYPRVEVVVVDDCSSDGSRALIESYGEQVTACFRDNNGGMSASANTGFATSSGELVLFLDADDYLYPHTLTTFAEHWRPGVVQAQARLDLIDAEGNAHDTYPPPEASFSDATVKSDLALRGRYATTVTSGLAFARTALEQVMPIPESDFDRSADGYLATVVPLYGEVVSIDQSLGAYRRHAGNHSGFAANIATRSRWRIDHDEKRYAALRVHGPRNGVTIAPDPGLRDQGHLEERLASLCFDPGRHPYAGDSRARLGAKAIAATLASSQNIRRKLVHSVIYFGAGFGPRFTARPLLAWKMERSSRPEIIDKFSGWLRRRLK